MDFTIGALEMFSAFVQVKFMPLAAADIAGNTSRLLSAMNTIGRQKFPTCSTRFRVHCLFAADDPDGLPVQLVPGCVELTPHRITFDVVSDG